MTGPSPIDRLGLARARATAARARLAGTIGQLQERAKPTSLVHDVTETLKERGTDIVTGLVDTAKSNPARAGAAVAMIGLFLARHHVIALVRRAAGRPGSGDTPAKRGSAT